MRRGNRPIIQAFAVLVMLLSLISAAVTQTAAAPMVSGNQPLRGLNPDSVQVSLSNDSVEAGQPVTVSAVIGGSFDNVNPEATVSFFVSTSGLPITSAISCDKCTGGIPPTAPIGASGAYPINVTFDVAVPGDATPGTTYTVTVTAEESASDDSDSGSATITVAPTDTDDDGIPDADDSCPDDANTGNDSDGDGTDDACDTQDDTDTDGDGTRDEVDTDDDGDGIPDVDDSKPLTPNDGDGDGIEDEEDSCPTTVNSGVDADDDDIDDACDTEIPDPNDTDGDGVVNNSDNCVNDYNPSQADQDDDNIGDKCDDSDNDGTNDDTDNCVNTPNEDQADTNENGIGDVCEDGDNDGIPGGQDNCPGVSNETQDDFDGDGLGDACDDDVDGDGVDDLGDDADNCMWVPNAEQIDTDGSGAGDACDGDDDNDGVEDDEDNCRVDANSEQTDTDGDGIGDACDQIPTGDDDRDGIENQDDNCPTVANNNQADADDNGIGDVCETRLTVNITSSDPDLVDALDAASTLVLKQGDTVVANVTIAAGDLALPSSVELADPVPFGTYTLVIDGGDDFALFSKEITLDAATESVNAQLAAGGSEARLVITSANPDFLNETGKTTLVIKKGGETVLTTTLTESGFPLPKSFNFTDPFAFGTYTFTVDAGDEFKVFSDDFVFDQTEETVEIVLEPSASLVDQLVAILVQILDDILNG